MSKMRVPTEADWRSERWSIDTPEAYRNFFGKNTAEAFDLIVRGARPCAEDIMHMPAPCFQYYLHAYMDYLLSDKSAGRPSGAYCFFGVVRFRSDDINGSAGALRQRVRDVLGFLRDGQQRFDADPTIWGDFRLIADDAKMMLGE